MNRTEIRIQINELKRKKRTLELNIQKCNRAITKLEKVLESLIKCKEKLSDAKTYLDNNIINNKPADKGKTNNNLNNIEIIKNKINSLINNIDSDINNYQSEINSIESRIAQLEYELTITED